MFSKLHKFITVHILKSKLIRLIKKHNKFLVCLLITAVMLVLLGTIFNWAFVNFWVSLQEFGLAFWAYLMFMFTFTLPHTSPIFPPDYRLPEVMPNAPSEFGSNIAAFFRLFITGENFTAYTANLETFLIVLASLLPVLLLLYFVLKKYVKRQFSKQNNRYNKDTIALKGFKRGVEPLYTLPLNYCKDLIAYVANSRFLQIWKFIAFFSFNIFAIILSLFAIILYFFISLNFVSLYFFFAGVVVNLYAGLSVLPLWVMVIAVSILVLYLVDRWRKRVGYSRLTHMENMNKGFLKIRSICSMLVGSMGKWKTAIMTDMCLSWETIFRFKAREIMHDISMMFPHFPFINFELDLKKAIYDGRILNFVQASDWVLEKENDFKKHYSRQIKKAAACSFQLKKVTKQLNKCYLFDYDKDRYGLEFDDKKQVHDLFEVLKEYAKAYFLYFVKCSLIFANYSIRTDFVKHDIGNMPIWDLDFFLKDSKKIKAESRYCKILNFDMVRLGKKMDIRSRVKDAFEFGVIVITEAGKERGNQFKEAEIRENRKELRDTLKEIDKNIKDLEKSKKEPLVDLAKLEIELKALETNRTAKQNELLKLLDRVSQLNDKFNAYLKLIRHKSTVWHFPFARVVMDEQRPESIGADARDLCEIVHIKEKSELKLSMPLFFLGQLFYGLIVKRFLALSEQYRFNRGDNTLLMHLFKLIACFVWRNYIRIYNIFGYHVLQLQLESSATGEKQEPHPYYFSIKKTFSNRYKTDAYTGMLSNRTRQSKVGILQMPEYKSVVASEQDFLKQKSLFIRDDIEKYSELEE